MTLDRTHEYPPELDDHSYEQMVEWLKEKYPSYVALCKIDGENSEIQRIIDAAIEAVEEWAMKQEPES